ncbi:hypothetical protein CcrC1_gp316 [Caulobacter phage C1]|nr:hypothetical protein CcrC1_gp316 [Caulobacter phage C1]UTU08545.1 hypothetical protein CcrC2_gp317 [Caulobacter phage C2]UTU09061.1 hypothetical protein CcrJ4_gp312 [Caulobacter phage J4]UTU10178.1 hypothetical protein CcrRB23_gp316 [Caulobacter phage RB23]WGN97212.1 hypothetical protein [Bertelyvirus sp.]
MAQQVQFTAVDIDDRRQQILRAVRDAVLRHRSDKKPWTHPTFEALRDAADAGAKDRIWRMEAAGYVDGTRNTLLRLRGNYVLPQGLEMQPMLDALIQVYQVLSCDDLVELHREETSVHNLLDILERTRPRD